MQAMSTIRKDFVASHIRSQLDRLRVILNNIEDDGLVNCGYAQESIREIETNLRQIRKLCEDN